MINKSKGTYRSHCLNVHDAIIHNDTIKTSKTVPGHIVIRVLSTNLYKILSYIIKMEIVLNHYISIIIIK